jgi:predicted enzyme related to lactoylglutathione lyase
MSNKTPKVTGVGGIFFKCKDPDAVKKWYGDNLGFDIDAYGSSFKFKKLEDPTKNGYLQWSPFEQKTTYFEPSDKEFMVNYRVQNLEQLLINLREAGVTILDKVETFDYGKFVHILDPEGNKIELWEPVDEVFDKFYEEE